jgi:hypothetical protein
MPSKLNLVGLTIGRLTITERVGTHTTPGGVRRSLWRCTCSCGGETTISAKIIAAKSSLSCGCLQKERVSTAVSTHRGSRSKLYKVWTSMKQRCHNQADAGYKVYGARGITVCDEWRDSFAAFRAAVGDPPAPGMSIDRIDGTKGYEPGNVRWATSEQQMSNTSRTRHLNYKDETLTMKQWSVRMGIPYATLRQRIDKGMSVADALETPINIKLSNTYRKRSAISSAESR